jgi:guanine deaminase
MDPDELMAEACRLAEEAVQEGWGGPFGAVIALDGEIVGRGQNRVLLTGDPTCHAEVEAIRDAVARIGAAETLALVDRPEGSDDTVPQRARMLLGAELYTSGAPCPMCMSAIYWARIGSVRFANDWEAARSVGFDDAFQYEDFARPLAERRLPIAPFRPDLGRPALDAWAAKTDRHPY